MKSAADIHMTELCVPAQKDECDSLSILFWGYIITCPCRNVLYLALQNLFVIIIEWCMFPQGLHHLFNKAESWFWKHCSDPHSTQACFLKHIQDELYHWCMFVSTRSCHHFIHVFVALDLPPKFYTHKIPRYAKVLGSKCNFKFHEKM